MGWERPNWFAGVGKTPDMQYGWGRGAWFDSVAAEHRATREAVTVTDETSFGKILVQGRDAEAALQRLAANDVAVPVGRTVYTGILNERGTFESDLTDCAPGSGQVPDHHRLGAADPRHGLAEPSCRRERPRHADRRNRCVDRAVHHGAEQSRPAAEGEPRRFLQRGLSVCHHSRDRRGSCHGAGLAPHLHGRAGLGALRAGRIRRHRVRDPAWGRRGIRPARCRLLCRRELAPGEGLPRLGPRAHAGRHALPGRPWLGGQARQAGRLHRPESAGRGQSQAAGTPPRVGGAGGWRAAAVGRRDAAARRQAGRRSQLRRLRPHAWAPPWAWAT